MNSQEILKEVEKIVKAADERGMVLRAIGATAFMLHCPKSLNCFEALGRELSDIDLITLWKYEGQVDKFFADIGWNVDASWMWGRREFAWMYNRRLFKKNDIKADVFFDKICMCHTIDLRDRLTVDYPTISLADMLLAKAQIVKINEKDIKDLIIMFREHDIGMNDKETVNANYIAKLLSEDWGLYYSVTENLKKIKNHFTDKYLALTKEDRADVRSKVEKLLEIIDKKPKSLGWRIRAKIGTRQKWYQDVEEMRQ